MTSRKRFEVDQVVEVQRDVGRPWEPAKYRGACDDMRGWHQVDLLGEPRRVDSMTGYDTDSANPRGFTTPRCIVPSQRVRAKESP